MIRQNALEGGKLVLAGIPSITASGKADFGKGATLSFPAENIAGGPLITGNQTHIDASGAQLDIAGYDGERDIILLSSANVIDGDFQDYLVNGVSTRIYSTHFEIR